MREILSLRQENSKTFDIGGGKRQWQGSIGAIHYKDNYADKSEQWKDIDLTWEGNRITKAPYELIRDGKKLTIKDKKTGEVSTIELLVVKPAGLSFEVIPEFSAVRFRHTLTSDKIPFEAQFRIAGKIPFLPRCSDGDGEIELGTKLQDGILTEKLSSVKDKLTGKVRLARGNIKVDPTWQVGASTDDVWRRLNASGWEMAGEYVSAGGHGGANKQHGGGMRFAGVAIDQGATITTAKLTFRARYWAPGAGDAGANTRISAEDVDDAATFADNAATFDTRWANRTTARVDWDNIAAWTEDTDYDSVDFSTVIKEVVDRGGWASGQDIVIFWEDFEDRSATDLCGRYAQSWDYDSTHAPKLVVTYAVVVTPSTLALTLTEYAPTVLTPRLVTPPTLALSLTEYAPTVSTPRLVTPSTLALTLTEYEPTVSTPRLVTPTTLALSLTEYAPTVVIAVRLLPEPGSSGGGMLAWGESVKPAWIKQNGITLFLYPEDNKYHPLGYIFPRSKSAWERKHAKATRTYHPWKPKRRRGRWG